MYLLWLWMILLVPSVTLAAYDDPDIISNDGKQMLLEFKGNAGEETRTSKFVFQNGTTVKKAREWVKDTVDELDGVRSSASLPAFQPGQKLTRLNRTAAVRAAKELWNEKLSRYLQVKDSGILATATELAAMKADLEATYQSGFLAP